MLQELLWILYKDWQYMRKGQKKIYESLVGNVSFFLIYMYILSDKQYV